MEYVSFAVAIVPWDKSECFYINEMPYYIRQILPNGKRLISVENCNGYEFDVYFKYETEVNVVEGHPNGIDFTTAKKRMDAYIKSLGETC